MSKLNCTNHKKILLLCVFIVTFSILSFVMTPVTKPSHDSATPVQKTKRPAHSSEIYHYKDRQAFETYEKRNAEIDSWIKDDEIPDHNNAALLYYQALLLRPDHDQRIINKFYDVYWGAEPNTQIKIFLGQWLPTMKIAAIASRIPQCTWDVWPENAWPEEKTSRIFLMKSFRHFSYIIAVDAITLASEGHHRAALERCMTLRRITRHLSHSSQLHLISSACDGIALRTIHLILGDMPLDANILTWLKDQLETFQIAPSYLERTLQEYLKAKIDSIRSSSIARLRGMLLKGAADERARQHIRNLTDDQIRDEALRAVQDFYDSIFVILHSDKSGEQKCAEIQEATHYTINQDVLGPQTNIYKAFGDNTFRLMTGIQIQSTEEQKLAEIQRIIDKSAEPNTVELLTKFATAVGVDVDFGFLVNSEMPNKQKRANMQKAIDELNEAYAIKTSRFGLTWSAISERFEPPIAHKAHLNSLKAAIELYLIMAKTGRLPEELTEYLPKDPCTGRDFSYKKNEDGFSLGCRSDIFKNGKERFTFKALQK